MVLLEKKYSQQKDEWELIVMKAEMWLQGQSLPSGVTVASLKEIAAKLFKFIILNEFLNMKFIIILFRNK